MSISTGTLPRWGGMPSVGLLKEALRLLEACGYTIRLECLDGSPGGVCVVKGQKFFFVDVRLSPQEQLEVALKALAEEPKISELGISARLAKLFNLAKLA